MSDSEESLPDLVASSSSECESDDEAASGKGAKASVSACCSLCAHHEHLVIAVCATLVSGFNADPRLVQRAGAPAPAPAAAPPAAVPKPAAPKPATPSAPVVKPGFLSSGGGAAAAAGGRASTGAGAAAGATVSLEDARKMRTDIALKRPTGGALDAELDQVFPQPAVALHCRAQKE